MPFDYHPLLVAAFVSLLGVAVWMDIAARRVPNAVSVSLAGGGICAQLVTHGWSAGLQAVAILLATAFLLLAPWAGGRIGGGDLKLAAGAATWIGWPRVLIFVVAGALAGGAVAIVTFLVSQPSKNGATGPEKGLRQRLAAGREKARQVSVPYSIAIAFGGIYALFLPGWPW